MQWKLEFADVDVGAVESTLRAAHQALSDAQGTHQDHDRVVSKGLPPEQEGHILEAVRVAVALASAVVDRDENNQPLSNVTGKVSGNGTDLIAVTVERT